ncbi:MAG TPA: Hpt domain-containing protein [Bacteroidia bacterium]|jgi:HPt (histidine-containing phosphotransfer) domain-containing protein|nr:Hpt domain-containing protein [Bacteroidia bacterium]
MASVVSFTEIEKITSGDAPAMKQLLQVFIKETTLNTQKMQEYLNAENWEELKKTTHKLKSSLALVGLADYRTLAEDIEKTAGADIESTQKKTAQLTEACQSVIYQTEKKLKEFP